MSELWLQKNDPGIVHELYRKARAKGRSSKEFIEFASSIFDYWQKFYDTAVELDIRDKETRNELIELRQQLAQQPSVDVLDAAKAVVERWDTPLWKDVPHTAIFIHKLRDSLQAMNEAKTEKDVK